MITLLHVVFAIVVWVALMKAVYQKPKIVITAKMLRVQVTTPQFHGSKHNFTQFTQTGWLDMDTMLFQPDCKFSFRGTSPHNVQFSKSDLKNIKFL